MLQCFRVVATKADNKESGYCHNRSNSGKGSKLTDLTRSDCRCKLNGEVFIQRPPASSRWERSHGLFPPANSHWDLTTLIFFFLHLLSVRHLRSGGPLGPIIWCTRHVEIDSRLPSSLRTLRCPFRHRHATPALLRCSSNAAAVESV